MSRNPFTEITNFTEESDPVAELKENILQVYKKKNDQKDQEMLEFEILEMNLQNDEINKENAFKESVMFKETANPIETFTPPVDLRASIFDEKEDDLKPEPRRLRPIKEQEEMYKVNKAIFDKKWDNMKFRHSLFEEECDDKMTLEEMGKKGEIADFEEELSIDDLSQAKEEDTSNAFPKQNNIKTHHSINVEDDFENNLPAPVMDPPSQYLASLFPGLKIKALKENRHESRQADKQETKRIEKKNEGDLELQQKLVNEMNKYKQLYEKLSRLTMERDQQVRMLKLDRVRREYENN
jgi:hypothetical protein